MGDEGGNHAENCGKNTSGRWHGKCKGPEAGRFTLQKEVIWARTERVQERALVREVEAGVDLEGCGICHICVICFHLVSKVNLLFYYYCCCCC